MDSPAEEVFELIREIGVTYPVAQVGSDTVTGWGATALPATFVLDHTHTIRWARFGAVTESEIRDVVREFAQSPTK